MPISIQQALNDAVRLLCDFRESEVDQLQYACRQQDDTCDTYLGDVLFEAEVLLAFVLDKPRSYLRAWPEKELTLEQEKLFTEYVTRRRQLEPIAYITGIKEFWSLPLLVTPETLIPRPETELLVEQVLAAIPKTNASISLADLGTGSGAIALALAHERPAWSIYAIDVSESALAIASKNAQRLGINNVSFCLGNWCTALPCSGFDVIVSNPPYISETEWEIYAGGLQFEPRNALVSGKDGLDAIREIVQNAKMHLKSGGYIFLEHGFMQGAAVRELLIAMGYQNVHTVADLSGQPRVTVGISG